MIELTEQLFQALANPKAMPLHLANPQTKKAHVLLRVEEYQRLVEDEYDDSPWTREELQAPASEVAEPTGWEDYGDAADRS